MSVSEEIVEDAARIRVAATTVETAIVEAGISQIRTAMTSVAVNADKTLDGTDDYTTQVVDSASAATITIPPNSDVAFGLDTRINIYQAGLGAGIVSAGSGVTLENTQDNFTAGQGATITLWQRALDTWVVDGKRGAQVQPGIVQYYPSTTVPTGWLKADGAAISRVDYADLFAVIFTTFGEGDGSTTFNLPDLRGEFLRGLDDGRGVDAGRLLGVDQDDAFQGHAHNFVAAEDYTRFTKSDYNGAGGGGGAFFGYADSTSSFYSNDPADNTIHAAHHLEGANGEGTPRTADETRPRNVAMLVIIKT